MNYYKISTIGIDRKIIGFSPQCTGGTLGDIQKEILPKEGLVTSDFKLPIPKMNDKANFTDFLNVTMIPSKFLVFNDRFLGIIKKFEIEKYQNWKLKIENKEKGDKSYNLFFINYGIQNQIIDFKKSVFYLGKLGDNDFNAGYVKIKNATDYIEKSSYAFNKSFWLKSEKITISFKNYNKDMFRLVNSPLDGYYISEDLKKIMKENSITGVRYKNISNIKNICILEQ